MRTPTTNKNTTIFFFYLFICFFTVRSLYGVPASAEMPSVEFSGTAKWHLLRRDGSIAWSRDYSFIVQVASNGWNIKQIPTASEQGPVEVAGSDNIDTYRAMDNSYITNRSTIKQFGTVCEGTFPSEGSKELQVLWLTFLYPKYYTNTIFSRPITLSEINYQITEGAKINIELDQNAHLLKNMEFQSQGVYFSGNQTVRLNSPLNSGYKLWSISISDVINLPNISVPSKIQYSQYLPVNNNQIFMNWSADISVESVTNLKPTLSEDFLPVITNKTLMTLDYRFAPRGQPVVLIRPNQNGVDVAQYNLSKGQWLNRDQASVFAGYKVAASLSTGHDISKKRKLIVWMMFIFTTIGLFLILWKSKRNETNQK
jgi:hypothetical protein